MRNAVLILLQARLAISSRMPSNGFHQVARVLLKTCTSNIEILERFQSKALRMIVDAPRYVPNTVIRRDLQTPTVKEQIHRYSSQYSARLSAHPDGLEVNFMEQPDNRRLRRHLPNDLPTRFLVQLLNL
jgi:hypothetical protein